MGDWSLSEVRRLVAAVNVIRRRSHALESEAESNSRLAEQELDARFRTSESLAVYGSLAPGQLNYHIVEPLRGKWMDGLIEGTLLPVGWGADLGYPAFRPQNGGAVVAAKVLTSPLLATAWPMLDDFEGLEYQRILVPVFSAALGSERRGERRLYTVANVYAAREECV